MKKFIISLLLILLPTNVFAVSVVGIQGNSVQTKKSDIETKLNEVTQSREQVQVLNMELAEIQEQTQTQLQTNLIEVKQLKLEMQENFMGLKDLTEEERTDLSSDIEEIKEELKSIHVAWLKLRCASQDSEETIEEGIQEISTETNITDNEQEILSNILEDISSL